MNEDEAYDAAMEQTNSFNYEPPAFKRPEHIEAYLQWTAESGDIEEVYCWRCHRQLNPNEFYYCFDCAQECFPNYWGA